MTESLERDWHRGDWMQTYTGRAFFPLDPDPEQIDIRDIAHALGMQCRYNGHVHRFYSVAEHCVHVSAIVPREHALWGLLHDGTEAYVGDMIRPLKLHMPDYVAVEDAVMEAIAVRFGLSGAPHMPDEVKAADTQVLLDERIALLGTPPHRWNTDREPAGVKILGLAPDAAARAYLERFAELAGSPMPTYPIHTTTPPQE